MRLFARLLDEFLIWFVIAQMVILTTVVVVAVAFRYSGASLSWYDEVASILLAWLTYWSSLQG